MGLPTLKSREVDLTSKNWKAMLFMAPFGRVQLKYPVTQADLDEASALKHRHMGFGNSMGELYKYEIRQ